MAGNGQIPTQFFFFFKTAYCIEKKGRITMGEADGEETKLRNRQQLKSYIKLD